MTTFVQLLVNGLGKGAVYALLALGFVIIYKSTEVVNFAHGALVLLGGYVVVLVQPHAGWFAGAALGVATAGLGALLLERLLISRARLADANSLALMTIGIDVIITEEIIRRLGVDIPFLGEPYDAKPIQVGDIT